MNKQKADLKQILKVVGIYSFYLAVIIEVTLVVLDKSEFLYPYEGWTFRITFSLFLIKVLFTRYNRKEYLFMVLFLGLGYISYRITGRNEILRIVVFLAACKDVDMIRCLKMVFWMTLAGCVGIVLLSVSGIYGAVTLTQDFGRGGSGGEVVRLDRIRWGCGRGRRYQQRSKRCSRRQKGKSENGKG